MSRAYSYKWRLAKDWEQPTKRAIVAIIMQSEKTLLIKASSGTTSQGLNDHRGYGDLFIVITWCENVPSQPKESIKGEYHNTMLLYAKATRNSFKAH